MKTAGMGGRDVRLVTKQWIALPLPATGSLLTTPLPPAARAVGAAAALAAPTHPVGRGRPQPRPIGRRRPPPAAMTGCRRCRNGARGWHTTHRRQARVPPAVAPRVRARHGTPRRGGSGGSGRRWPPHHHTQPVPASTAASGVAGEGGGGSRAKPKRPALGRGTQGGGGGDGAPAGWLRRHCRDSRRVLVECLLADAGRPCRVTAAANEPARTGLGHGMGRRAAVGKTGRWGAPLPRQSARAGRVWAPGRRSVCCCCVAIRAAAKLIFWLFGWRVSHFSSADIHHFCIHYLCDVYQDINSEHDYRIVCQSLSGFPPSNVSVRPLTPR